MKRVDSWLSITSDINLTLKHLKSVLFRNKFIKKGPSDAKICETFWFYSASFFENENLYFHLVFVADLTFITKYPQKLIKKLLVTKNICLNLPCLLFLVSKLLWKSLWKKKKPNLNPLNINNESKFVKGIGTLRISISF